MLYPPQFAAKLLHSCNYVYHRDLKLHCLNSVIFWNCISKETHICSQLYVSDKYRLYTKGSETEPEKPKEIIATWLVINRSTQTTKFGY